MVRKKLKKPHGAVSHGQSPAIDPAEVVISWLRDLQLLKHDSIPAIGLNLSHLDILLPYGPPLTLTTALAQVDGLRTLRAAIVAGKNIEGSHLRVLFLASMLLYIDSMAYALRKSLRELLLAIKETTTVQRDRTDYIAEVVVTKFIDLAWRIGERCRVTCSKENMEGAMRLAISLQWLLDVPGAGRALVGSGGGLQLGRSLACLSLMMEAQAAILQGQLDYDVQNRPTAEADVVAAVMEHGKSNALGVPLTKRVSVDVNFCSEILKAASSLISFAKDVDMDKLPGGDAAARRMCEICLMLLSHSTVHRETITHASAVLTHLAIASWRVHERWSGDTAVLSTVRTAAGKCSRQLKVAASTIVESFFPGHYSGRSSAYESSGGIFGNLFTGPILHVILRNGGADKGLQLRFFALQVLETWCSKAEFFSESGLMLQDPAGSSTQERHYEEQANISHMLSEMTDLVVAALLHPSRFISSMAPSLLEHTVNLRHRVRTSRGEVDGQEIQEWDSLMVQVLKQPDMDKGKYMALAVLLPRIGALQSIKLCPSLVKRLVWAVGIRGNVSGQATSLLLQLLDSLKQEIRAKSDKASMLKLEVMHACRCYWVGPAATALMQVDAWSRNHVADYLLPEVFKFDPGSAARLCSELRSRGCREATLLRTDFVRPFPDGKDGSRDPEVRQMWAIMEIARLARKSGTISDLAVVGGQGNVESGDTSTGLLQLDEVEWAALHADEALRISALSLLCTDARVTTVPVAAETELLRKVLPYSLKVFSAQNRQNLLRAIQTLLIRMRETVRVCSKHLSKAKPHTKGASDFAEDKGRGGSDRSKGHGKRIGASCKSEDVGDSVPVQAGEERPRAEPVESPDGTVKRVRDFSRWLCEVRRAINTNNMAILQSLYPGCPFEREVLGLEVVQLVLSELQPRKEAHAGKHGNNSLAQVVASSLFCCHWVDTLLNFLGSSWERTRCLSYAILSRFPRPLPGYDSLDGAIRLASEGLRLAGSGRQRDSDRGALILRLVFVAYARDLGLGVPLVALETGQKSHAESAVIGGIARSAARGDGAVDSDSTVRFLDELCTVMSLRLDGMERSLNKVLGGRTGDVVDNASSDEKMTTSLPHGLFLAVHHVLIDSRLDGGSAAEGRKQRRSKPRTLDSTGDVGKNVADLNRRREVMGLLLAQTSRALRLSHLIVSDDGEGGNGSGDGPVEDFTKSIGYSGGSEVDMGTVTGGLNHSVNANGHVGMVSVDCFRRSVPPTVRRGDTEAEVPSEAEAGCRVQDADVVEGQRTVVGAWLLAREACRCLATMVTASPFPLEDKTEKKDTDGVESKSLLTVNDVAAIGETLLRSMLSFKHMGCIVSAQAAFQTVCESLLHSAGHDGVLSGLPSVWLEKLLRQLDEAGQEFVLKRSAGLALAFMSIFRAEPRSVAPVLLPRGMRCLLALAETSQQIEELLPGTGMEENAESKIKWKSMVIALNVLRQAFVDAPLADDVGPYVTQATKAAVRGFEHPTWAVRNSSMMLFASVMQRAVGGAKNAGNLYSLEARRPHSAKAAVTAEDFFKQHKQLHPFLLSQLETAADHMAEVHPNLTGEPRSGASGPGRAKLHPALYPILLLLARLRSRGAETTVMQMEVGEQVDVDQSAKPTAAFVPAVIRCGRNPHFLARASSARALAALVPPPESLDLIHDLMRGLPKSVNDLALLGAGAYNFIHGTLLQVQELLLVARAVRDSGRMSVSTAMPDHKDTKDENSTQWNEDPGVSNELSEDTVMIILDRVWLADPQILHCPPVRHAMLLVLRALHQPREHLRDSINERVLSSLQSMEELHLTDVTRAGSAGRFVPGNSLLGSTVVDAAIRRRLEGTFGTTSTEGDKERGAAEVAFVVGLLCSSDVDVRDAAIKSTKRFFGDSRGRKMFTPEDQGALQQLWAGVTKALAVEARTPNVRRLVRLLCRIGLQLDADQQLVSPEPLWCLLRKLCIDMADVSDDVRAGALKVMGSIVRLGEKGALGSSGFSRLREYVSLLESAVDSEQPMLTAAAAATSLAVSGVLSCFLESSGDVGHRWEGTDGGLTTICVRLLFVTLMLLQDNDQRVRSCVACTWAQAAESTSIERDVEGVMAPSIGRGGRVDICATEHILERLAVLSESVGDKGSVAEQFSSDLIRAIEKLSRVEVEGLLMALSVAGEGDEENARTRPGWGGQDDDDGDKVWEDLGGGIIFDKEDRKQFHEPVPFACIAGPYLKRALIAIRTRSGVVPQAVTLGLARVLNGLSDGLEALAGFPRAAPRVTWLPAVYQGIVASTAVGAAAVGFVSTGGAVLCSKELSRALDACRKFDGELGRDEGLHPVVLSAVERMLNISL